MSLCTLPAPVLSKLMAISPRMDLVLFVTDTHILLCRRSGQQVWSTRLPRMNEKEIHVASVSWSPDGRMIALIFDNGSYTIYDVNSGRPNSCESPKEQLNITSLLWTNSSENAKSRVLLESIIDEFFPLQKSNFNNSIAALGTSDGHLKINFHGSLDVDEFEVEGGNTECIYLLSADEESGEYAAVQGSKLHVYQSKTENGNTYCQRGAAWMLLCSEDSLEKTVARCSARATLLADELYSGFVKLEELMKSMHDTRQKFLEGFKTTEESSSLHDLQSLLLESAVFGVVDDTLQGWINFQHEQGFKKWYKDMTSHWDAIQRLLTDDLLDLLTNLIAIWSQLDDSMSTLQTLHETLLSTISQVIPLREVFEYQAAYIEYVFKEEIDRPIAATKIGAVNLGEIGCRLLDGTVLGVFEEPYGTTMISLAVKLREQLELSVSKIKVQLRRQLEGMYTCDLGGKATQIKKLDGQSRFAAILDASTLVVVGDKGDIEYSAAVAGSDPIFTGDGYEVVSLSPEDQALIMPNGDHKKLSFEPIKVVSRKHDNRLTFCVLSKDCQHYQFIDVDSQHQ